MDWKNQLTKTPYLVLFIVLITVGVGTASALTITLSADLIEFLGILDMNFNRITNVGTPTTDTDAATKAYVDQASSTDTLASLGCTTDQIAKFDGNNWICIDENTDSDTLTALGCTTDQIAKFDGNNWICGKQIAIHNPITTVDSPGFLDFHTSIAIGADNNPVISYYDSASADLRVAHCGNPSCSAGNTITPIIDGTNFVGKYSSIAIGTDNNPVISYHDSNGADLKVVHCGNQSCSAGNTITTVFGTATNVGRHTSLAIGTDNNPVISFYDSSNDWLKVAHCNDIACSTTPNITTVDTSADVGWFTSISIGSDNFPVISYVDNTNNYLKVVHCGHIACLGFNTITTVDNSGFVDFETSIAIGSDGLPVIGYFDTTNGNLKFVHCGNALCNSDNTTITIDTGIGTVNSIPGHVSVAIDRNNNPVISYWDAANKDLKVAHCGNITCSAVNSISIVDGANDVGTYSSIAIGADNNPVISYIDETNFALKVAVDGTVLIFE